MTTKDLVKGKTIVVTGSASGIGYEIAKLLTAQGAKVLGVDLTKNFDHVEEFYRADLSDKRTIEALVDTLPEHIDGIVNSAGLPPTAPADKVLAVNLVGLKYFTQQIIPKLNDGASIVNLVSLAGFGWQQSVEAIKASDELDFHNVKEFAARWNITNEEGRSYFFFKRSARGLDYAKSLDLAGPRYSNEYRQPWSCRYTNFKRFSRNFRRAR